MAFWYLDSRPSNKGHLEDLSEGVAEAAAMIIEIWGESIFCPRRLASQKRVLTSERGRPFCSRGELGMGGDKSEGPAWKIVKGGRLRLNFKSQGGA